MSIEAVRVISALMLWLSGACFMFFLDDEDPAVRKGGLFGCTVFGLLALILYLTVVR